MNWKGCFYVDTKSYLVPLVYNSDMAKKTRLSRSDKPYQERMRAFFRMLDPRGTLYTHRIEVVVNLRNGGV